MENAATDVIRSARRVEDRRFLLALAGASAIHAALILLLRFQTPARPRIESSRPPLEVTLIKHGPRLSPQTPRFLAPEAQVGPAPEVREQETALSPEPEPAAEPPQPATPPAPPARPHTIAGGTRKRSVVTRAPAPEVPRLPSPISAKTEVTAPPKLAVADLLALAGQIDQAVQQEQAHTNPKRTLYINSVNAQKYKAAAYEKAWHDKVERIGNLNYPEEARRKRLAGSLVLSVAIRHDGSLEQVELRRSSGHPELDQSAIRIVRLAAPFARFPAALKQEADVLVITRTWKFYSDQLRTEN